MKNIIHKRHKDLGELQDLLLLSCIPDKNGQATIKLLSAQMDLKIGAFYSWIAKGQIPRDKANHLVAMNNLHWTRERLNVKPVPTERVVSMADFEPFIKPAKKTA